MSSIDEWHDLLKSARESLNRSPNVPEWLKASLDAAIAIAPDLAPEAPVPRAAPDFFYPH